MRARNVRVERSHVPIAPTKVGATAEDRRGAIRDAALALFATRGYRSTTMADIGERVGIRGPSLYKHVGSKQELLAEIMVSTMEQLLLDHRRATATSIDDTCLKLRRAVEAHALYHARHQFEAFVGNREIDSLEEPQRAEVLALRSRYERGFRRLIERGRQEGAFDVESPRLASYAILDMGMGVSRWFRPDGPTDELEIARCYGDYALRLVCARG